MLTALLLLACTSDDKADDTGYPEDLVLSPGFEEASVAGVSAAEEELTTCAGWFPASPQHTMTLEAAMTGLYLEASTDAVVVRVVFTDNGSEFCSDLDSGLPRIERGSWSAGLYEIFVGTPEQGSAEAYVLTAYE